MSPVYDFKTKLDYSKGIRQSNAIETLTGLIDGCESVRKTSVDTDKDGIDYIATLRGGAELGIDEKTREIGCSEYWQNGEPEFAPEIWSVMPGGKYNISRERAKAGWTLDESKKTDYIYCTFDPADTDKVYILPFQLYRMAFRRNLREWKAYYKSAIQDSRQGDRFWQSKCIFIPAGVVLKAIYIEMEVYKRKGQLELNLVAVGDRV